jgi:asparagine synthase (glutamine-hydrolysing)
MCGIAGLVHYDRSPINSELLNIIGKSLRERGPDDFGFLGYATNKPVKITRQAEELQGYPIALLHRRLSILDLSEGGRQPMDTVDGRYHIVFNGEIYNYIEIRDTLKAKGYHFRTTSDTEVLLNGYAHWGKDILNHLVGMFAFAILDIELQKLFLARDFFGIKPLYYVSNHGRFGFASEIKALLELPGMSRKVEGQSLYDYLTCGMTDHGDRTLFADIKQIPAAHYIEVDVSNCQEIKPIRYWQLELNHYQDLSFDQAASQLRELFLDSIALHLRSDVPVGAALSGGIDSSSIVAAMRYLEPKLEIHTFSYVADDPAINEEHWVDIMGQHANTVVHKVRATPDELVADLDYLISVQDEPFGSTSIYAQHRVFRLAHETGIKVMLDGQGADELLGGYRSYLSSRLESLTRQKKWLNALIFLHRSSQLPDVNILEIGAKNLLPSQVKRLLISLQHRQPSTDWLNRSWFAERGIGSTVLWQGEGKDVLRDRLYQTLHQTSVPMLLRYEDRNSMAHSLESRVPFLTPTLASFVFSLPESYIIDDKGVTKSIFRQAMRGIVPDTILDRQDKIGFATPEKKWLTALSPWVEKTLQSDIARQIPVLNIEAVQKEWENVLQDNKVFNFRIWRWVNLIHWADKFKVIF